MSFDESTQQLSLQRQLSMRNDQNWWNCKTEYLNDSSNSLCNILLFCFVVPVEFVQYLKVSYTPVQQLMEGRNLDFYYVFLREGVIRSTTSNEDEVSMCSPITHNTFASMHFIIAVCPSISNCCSL